MLVEQGDPDNFENYWIGLERLHQLTKHGNYYLMTDMIAENGTSYIEDYDSFIVQDSSTGYRMDVSGYFNGTTGSTTGSLSYHNGYGFSTRDAGDNQDCAATYNSGWWYAGCNRNCYNCNNVLDKQLVMRPFDDPNDLVYLQSTWLQLRCKNSKILRDKI